MKLVSMILRGLGMLPIRISSGGAGTDGFPGIGGGGGGGGSGM